MTQSNIETGVISTSQNSDLLSLVREAYENDLQISAKKNQILKLQFDSSTDNFQDVCNWISGNHYLPNGSELYLEVSDGMHNLSTYVDLKGSRTLDIRGTETPFVKSIVSATIASTATQYIYLATITLDSALENYVGIGYSIGLQNVRGNNGAESLNGGHIIKSISVDRKTITFEFRAYGVVPTSPTSFTYGVTLGLYESRVIIPRCCLIANNSGWDGSAREGFINILENSNLNIRHIGISYQGSTSAHDLIFSNGRTSIIIPDLTVLAGAGAKLIRVVSGGSLYANKACLGAGITGTDILQGAAGVYANFTRCSMSGGSVSTLTATDSTDIFITQSLLSGGVHQLRTTYESGNITTTNSRVLHGYYGSSSSKGKIYLDNYCVLKNNFKAIYENGGDVIGSPILEGNLNL